jgi:hypothetical protein
MERRVWRGFGAMLVVLGALQLSAACGSDDHSGEDHPHDECGGDDHDADHDHDAEKTVGPASGAECSDMSITYENFGKKFMTDYCLRCHGAEVTCEDRMGAPIDHNFDNLAEIDLLREHIDQKAAKGPDGPPNTSMPPSDPKPTDEEREKLGIWIACGVPE